MLLVVSAAALVLGGAALWTAPRWLLPHVIARAPGCLFSVPTSERAVAITIDDGPDPEGTPEILAVLREHGAHATFFLISSRVKGQESLVRRIVAEGHEIGNHLTREQPSIRLAPETFAAAVAEADTALAPFGPLKWLRPGGGLFNANMLQTIDRAGYRCALGSIYPFDPHLRSATIAAAYIVANTRPGAVIILHDGGARGPRTAETLRRALPELQARGYRGVTLTELDRYRSPAPTPR
jgi:peptidoglycan/xylan/chitin deacetylase (PgdA/CDA1 family)